MRSTDTQRRSVLQRIAQRVILEKGLLADFSGDALAELKKIHAPAIIDSEQVRNLMIFMGFKRR